MRLEGFSDHLVPFFLVASIRADERAPAPLNLTPQLSEVMVEVRVVPVVVDAVLQEGEWLGVRRHSRND